MVSRDSEHVVQSLGAILVQRFVDDCKVFTDRLSCLSDEFMRESQPQQQFHSYLGHIEELHEVASRQFHDLPEIEESRSEDSELVMRVLSPFRSAKELLGETRLRLLELESRSSPAAEFESAFQEAGATLRELYCETSTAFAGIVDSFRLTDDSNVVEVPVQDTQPEWTEERNTRRCDLIDKEIAGSITGAERIELNHLQNQAIAYRERVAPLPMAGAQKLHADLLRKKQEAEAGSEE